MMYLLWGLLNIGVLLLFIGVCFRATKLIRQNLGLLASIVFVFGLLSFAGNSNIDSGNMEPNSNQLKSWKFATDESLGQTPSSSAFIDLEKTLISKYYLFIQYGKDKDGQIIPVSGSSSTNGFISGTNWKPVSIAVNRTDDNNKFEYFVSGVVEWKLFGTTLYSQPKEYRGIIPIK